MEKIKTLASQHRKVSLLTLFALIVSIGFSAASAISAARQRVAEEAAKTESVDEQGTPDDGKNAEGKVEFSSSQKKLIDGYDDETKKLIETLSVSVFSTNNGRNTLCFRDDYYVETMNGKEQNHSYAISTAELGNNGSDSEIDRIVFETDAGIHIVTSTFVISAGNASAGEYTVASISTFRLTDMPHECKGAVKEVNITGLNSGIAEPLGDTDRMKKQLNDWCSIHFLVATTAAWIGTCNIDYNEDTISTAFTVGDGNSNETTGNTGASIPVTYNRPERKYSFST